MKNKKGFTLVELLVVIAIIGILAAVAIPSITTIYRRVNQRLYNTKKDYIVSAAEQYASDHPEVFGGRDSAIIYVYQLIEENYLNPDKEPSDDKTDGCYSGTSGNAKGCLIDPRAKDDADDIYEAVDQWPVLNHVPVKVTKKNVGVVAEIFIDELSENNDSATLIKKVCEGFENGSFYGKFGTESNEYCTCKYSGSEFSGLVKANLENEKLIPTNTAVEQCIIVSNKESGDVDNWLKYGSSTANWRVIGIYKGSEGYYTKLITASTID